MVLGYSRAVFVQFTTSQRLETFLRCHLLAFETFSISMRNILRPLKMN